MRVAAVQFKGGRNLAASRARLVALVERAADGADLVVCPELAVSGYVFADRDDAATVAEGPDGPTFRALADVAARRQAWVVCGFVERDGDRLHNSALVIAPSGILVDVYRKTLLFEADEAWATPGGGDYRVYDTGAGTFTVGICMDLNDARFLRWCAYARADVIAFPTCWLDEGEDVWPYWQWRASLARTALVAANGYGPEAPYRFVGQSAVLTPHRVLVGAPKDGDAVLRAVVRRR